MSDKKHLTAVIHAQKNTAALTDDEYRMVLYGATGKTSCTECTAMELQKVYTDLNEILEKKDKQVRDEIKTLSSTELVDLEKQFKEELFNLRFQLATGQLENTARLNKVRKNIARIKTALRQAELNK